AGDEVEDRGLACAVRADQAEDLALAHLHAQPIDGLDTAERLRDPVHFDQVGRRHGRTSAASPAAGWTARAPSPDPRVSNQLSTPPGRNVMISTTRAP